MPTVFEAPANNKPEPPPVHPHRGSHPHMRMRPLSAFAQYPKNVKFETQQADEHVELFLRQHPIVNAGWIFLAVIFITVPLLLFPFLSVFLPFQVPIGYALVGTVFWYLATFGFILVNFIQWFFNIYIVTNERIVDVDFKYLLYKHFSEAELDKIQDLSYTSGGILAAIFNYGSVTIQTAAEIPTIEFETVPHPEKVVETIRNLLDEM